MQKNEPFLKVRDLATGYGKEKVVRDVSMTVSDGEIVSIIGHNGAGKSTLLKAIFGILPLWEGTMSIKGALYSPSTPSESLDAGVVYVPQGNRVFENLTVEENLSVTASTIDDKALRSNQIQSALDLFPSLRGRLSQRAGSLSGGERQMLALCTARILDPRLLLLDEPSLGLAPEMTSKIMHEITRIRKGTGIGVIVVEQKVKEAIQIADRVYILEHGKVSYAGNAGDLEDEELLREVYL